MKRTKQITRWIIALAGLMIATGAVQAKDYDFKYGGLYYKITKKTGIVFYEVKVVPEKAGYPYYSDDNKPTGSVTIPKDFIRKVGDIFCSYTVTEIGEDAFWNCNDITSVSIPNSVKTIGKLAFSWCEALQSIDIPAGVITIGDRAFKNCTALKTVTVHWDTPLTVPGDVFKNVNTANVTLKVPKGKETDYKAHAVWGKFKFEGGTPPPPPPPPVVPVTSVTLNHHEVTVNGDISSKQLTATVQPAAATNKSLTWKSSNAAVASVDADGLVTIHKKGKATVTATANDGSGQSDACLFDVISTVANETVDGLRVYASGGALRLTLPSPATVHIYHVDGAMVKTLVLPAGDHVQPLPSGVYVVRVGQHVTKILIK